MLEQRLSLGIAAVLFGTYVCMLIFSLMTHRQMFAETREKLLPRINPPSQPSARLGHGGKQSCCCWSRPVNRATSEILVGSVETARLSLGVTEVFIGVIIVAIIGNAAEHSTAVWMATRNKMDLSLGIAIGSSLQIALFVAPLLVFISYFFGQPMDLEFSVPEIVAVIVAVHIVAEISNDGETNWLEGVQLLSVYLILAILFYFLTRGTLTKASWPFTHGFH